MKNLILLIAAGIFCIHCTQPVNAQKRQNHFSDRCGTIKYYAELFRTNPRLKKKFEENQEKLASMQRMDKSYRTQGIVDTIPVVIHVIANAGLHTKITDAVLQSQIDVLNEDFQGLNADSSRIPNSFKSKYGKSKIVFMLAKQNAYGEPSNGIERKVSSITYDGSSSDNAKQSLYNGLDAWDPSRFMNLWVVDFGSSGLLGISIFPGDPRPIALHGFICDYRAFGRGASYLYPEFNLGRTTTHEIGHFFNLRHIWGDDGGACSGSDFPNAPAGQDDTPNQSDATLGNPDLTGTGTLLTDACSALSPGIMYQNFMDYSDDVAMVMFTKGQQLRMETTLSSSPDRSPILNSDAYQPIVPKTLDAWIRKINSPNSAFSQCTNTFSPIVTLRNSGSTTLTTVTINYELDGALQSYTWTGSLAPFSETEVTLPAVTTADGLHTLKVYTQSPNGGTDELISNDASTTNFAVGAVTGPLLESFEGAVFPPAGWTVINDDNNTTWQKATGVAHSGTASAVLNIWNYPTVGKRDRLRSPAVKVSATDSVHLNFWVAHAGYPAASDSLIVKASADCGVTWVRIFARGSNQLKTTSQITDENSPNGFIPSSAADWQKHSINVSQFVTGNRLIIEFESYNGFGDNIFIDDIALDITNDIELVKLNKPSFRTCTSNEKPEVLVQNVGRDPITSIKLMYQVDNGPAGTYTWTGVLPRNAIQSISIPTASLGEVGNHTIKISVAELNGARDQDTSNNVLVKSYTISSPVALKQRVEEEFTNTQFPPSGWAVNNPDNDMTWERHATIGNKLPGSAWFNDWNNTTANRFDDLAMPVYSFSNIDSVFLHFNLASALYTEPNTTTVNIDTLTIFITKDCGNTLTPVYKKWGTELVTVKTAQQDEFFPRSRSEWRRDSINLTQHLGADENQFSVVFRFNGNFENNFFMDDVTLYTKTLPKRLKEQGYLVFPSVTQNRFSIWHYRPPTGLRHITVFSATGQLIWRREYKGNAGNFINVDLSGHPAGVYILRMGYDDKGREVTERIIKQ